MRFHLCFYFMKHIMQTVTHSDSVQRGRCPAQCYSLHILVHYFVVADIGVIVF